MRRTEEELETAGICAISIEDTALPRPYGANGKPSLSPVEEGVGKMKAALSARQDKNLVIAGRTSALGRLSLSNLIWTWAPIYRGTMIPGHMSKSEQQLRGAPNPARARGRLSLGPFPPCDRSLL